MNGKYSVVWKEAPFTKSLEENAASFFLDGFKGEIRPGQTLTYFGCGKGKLAKEFVSRGLNTTLVDISPYSLDEEVRQMLPLRVNQIRFVQSCLWQLPESLKSSYWIFSYHALEHLPEEKVDLVLKMIAERMRFGGYFSLSLEHKEKGWWEEKISNYFMICTEDVTPDPLFFSCRVLRLKER